MRSTETLTSILNKLHALHAIGFAKIADIASAVGSNRSDVHHWITNRTHRPNGESAIKLMNCASKLSNRMAIGGKEFQAGYRSAYQEACRLFPSTESES